VRLHIDVNPATAPGILAGLTQVNLREMRANGYYGQTPVLDGLYSGALRYLPQRDEEDWKTHSGVLLARGGDCKCLAPALAAELIGTGLAARPVAYVAGQRNGVPLWHVVVEVRPLFRPSFYVDPSVLGGMTGVA